MMNEPVLRVENLKKHFQTAKGMVHAVDDISFDIYRNRTLGLVGESGCGKSTTGRLIVKLLEPTDGRIIYEGKDYAALRGRKAKELRRAVQIIFQDPFSSLDPSKTVMQAISEPIIANKILTGKQKIENRVLDLMQTVGLTERLVNTYPHELDGGRRQRIGIARALAMEPKFIVCDEPVSALDVSIQAQILNLLKNLQKNLGLTLLFITHDLAVVNHVSDDIAVMYLGKIVEKADTESLFEHPLHPYTKALLSAIPIPDVTQVRMRTILKGEITSPIDPPDECRFYKRCPEAQDICKQSSPELREIEPGHHVACHLVGA